MKTILIVIMLVLLTYLGVDYYAHQWLQYKLRYLKRQVWLLFNRCPRCNTPVNRDRNQRAICPECGRGC